MNSINSNFVERYQLLYQKDPKSRVFAPLAEAYRKMGLMDEAYKICEKGVREHPHFPAGRVTFAKILIDKKEVEKAIEQLQASVELSPENIMAQSLLGDCLVYMKRPKEALRAFKMVLFLNPHDERAQKAVQKLESLTADEYETEVFEMKKLTEAAQVIPESNRSLEDLTLEKAQPSPAAKLDSITRQRTLERMLSLIDAYMVRNDIEKATEALKKAERELGNHPELQKRKTKLTQRHEQTLVNYQQETWSPEESFGPRYPYAQISKLKSLLQRINERRRL